MPRIVFLNRFYWPDARATGQLLADLAEALTASNHQVTVITSATAENRPRYERHRGVEIIRVGRSPGRETSARQKTAAFARFAAEAAVKLPQVVRRGDVVVPLTDPPLFAVAATTIARARGARIVHWIHDIYPEVAVAVTARPWLQTLAPLRNTAWRDADACVTLSDEMAEVVRKAGVSPERLHVVPNWAPAEAAQAAAADARACRAAWGLDDEFIVEYAGNLGRVHDAGTMVAAAALLRRNRRIAFVFVGGGARRAQLEAEVRRLNLPNVRYAPPQPRERLGATLGAGDLHVVTLRPGCERFVFPSKLYGIAAAARPVLFIGPANCEVARVVARHGLGRVVASGDATAAAATIEDLAADGAECRRLSAAALQFARRFDARAACARWEAILRSLEAP